MKDGNRKLPCGCHEQLADGQPEDWKNLLLFFFNFLSGFIFSDFNRNLIHFSCSALSEASSTSLGSFFCATILRISFNLFETINYAPSYCFLILRILNVVLGSCLCCINFLCNSFFRSPIFLPLTRDFLWRNIWDVEVYWCNFQIQETRFKTKIDQTST